MFEHGVEGWELVEYEFDGEEEILTYEHEDGRLVEIRRPRSLEPRRRGMFGEE